MGWSSPTKVSSVEEVDERMVGFGVIATCTLVGGAEGSDVGVPVKIVGGDVGVGTSDGGAVGVPGNRLGEVEG